MDNCFLGNSSTALWQLQPHPCLRTDVNCPLALDIPPRLVAMLWRQSLPLAENLTGAISIYAVSYLSNTRRVSREFLNYAVRGVAEINY